MSEGTKGPVSPWRNTATDPPLEDQEIVALFDDETKEVIRFDPIIYNPVKWMPIPEVPK